jgi:hypothetical protein
VSVFEDGRVDWALCARNLSLSKAKSSRRVRSVHFELSMPSLSHV